jgi:chromosome segregation ATPase
MERRHMTTWWELTIPAAGVIGGSIVTAVVQSINTRSQRANDRKIRFIEVKRAAYAKFLGVFEDAIEVAQRHASIRKSHEEIKQTLEEAQSRLKSISERISDKPNNEALGQYLRELKAISEITETNDSQLRKIGNTLTELDAKLKVMSDAVRDAYIDLRLLAPKPVREAADQLTSGGVRALANQAGLVRQRIEAYEEAVRRDLL